MQNTWTGGHCPTWQTCMFNDALGSKLCRYPKSGEVTPGVVFASPHLYALIGNKRKQFYCALNQEFNF
ncbi:hypothetical protein C0J52_00423 [Blattella germanica]|nr:hypothetical protein C0J52_00423 [Blattella germanica]